MSVLSQQKQHGEDRRDPPACCLDVMREGRGNAKLDGPRRARLPYSTPEGFGKTWSPFLAISGLMVLVLNNCQNSPFG
jgi:hypothetical protein